MQIKQYKSKKQLGFIAAAITCTLVLGLGLTGCNREAQGNEDDRNVTLPVISQGADNQIDQPEEIKPEIPVVSEEEAYKTMLVNITHPLAKDYTMELRVVDGSYKMDVRAADDMEQMLADARAEGLSPIICSGYRSIDRQTTLFKNKIQRLQNANPSLSYEAAFEEAKTVVAYPGTSEHNTGLAADIVAKSHQVLDDSQEKTAEQQWLMANSWKYGYILRYPSDKCDLTKIIYEPWHYRYVGKEVAAYLYENDLCLEEYWLQLAEQDPETYGYILEEKAPEPIVEKPAPAPAPQPTEPAPEVQPTEQPSAELPQTPNELDDSFTPQQQEAAMNQGSEQSVEPTGDQEENQTAAVDEPVQQ